eukprot:UN25712
MMTKDYREKSTNAKLRTLKKERAMKNVVLSCQQLSNKIEVQLYSAFLNGKLPPIIVPFRVLGLEENKNMNNQNNGENEKTVAVTLPDVGFDLRGVHITPKIALQHRICTIWWSYNPACKIRGGPQAVEKVIDFYKGSIRNFIATEFELKKAPVVEFKSTDDSESMQKVMKILSMQNQ